MKILYVENHPQFAAIVVKRFLPEHQVQLAPSVREAIDALNAEEFDLMLLDYDLDDGKGTELLRRLEGHSVRPLVIATSSHASGNEALLQAGADAVCAKTDFARIREVIAGLPIG